MNIRQYILENLKRINIDISDLTAETNFILRHQLGITNPYTDIDDRNINIKDLENIVKKRKQGIPLQYILNIAEFMGENFFVNENVLIPRPETELLVRKAINISEIFHTPEILDIGTGSGCIAIMIKKLFEQSKVTACDISNNALTVAKKNTEILNADITLIKSDLFKNIQNQFDIIVSNPPYIPPQAKATIQKEVRYEPDTALYTKDEYGIEFYEKIIKNSKKYLKTNGYICFELGINQSELVKNIFTDYNFSNIEVIKDLDNTDRVICAKVNNE